MGRRTYGQYCGLARALEIIGERWALLLVRDLLVGPRRFTDLRRGLPRIPTNVLSTRLKELEQAGVVRRSIPPRPASSVVYELTEYGQGLEEAVLPLGRWGAQAMGDPAPAEIITPDSMVIAIRSAFRPEAARGVRASYELRLGEVVLHARVDDGTLVAAPGPLPGADLVIETGPAIRALLAGETTAPAAVRSGAVHLVGRAGLLDTFVEVFRLPAMPAARPA